MNFPCRVLRDAMQVAAMFAADDNERSRMAFDKDGMHIRSRNYANSMMAWVDIPLKTPLGSYFEDEDIGIDSDKLYRMLSAYEPDDRIDFFINLQGTEFFITLRGDLGMLSCSQPSLSDIPSIPIFDYVQRCHPPVVRGDVGADRITGDVVFAFGNDTPLYIETQVNDCTVRVAIAPRIGV